MSNLEKHDLKKEFSFQVTEDLFNKMHLIANKEGKQFQVVVEEAMVSYIKKKSQTKIRDEVLNALDASIEKNTKLGELLAQ